MDSQQFDEVPTNETGPCLSEEISSRLKLNPPMDNTLGENLSKISNFTNDMSSKSSDLTENKSSTSFSRELVVSGNKLKVTTYENRNGCWMSSTDLITDDEKDANLSG